MPLRSHRLLDFLPRLSPALIRPEWLEPVASLLERVDAGEAVRAVVSVPPQHGKTELLLHGIAWLLLRHPDWPIGYASYNATQARSKSRLARDYIRLAGLSTRRDADSLIEWRLPEGGGLLARGIGEGLTGQALRLLIVDDPHKDRAEAESPACRKAILQWFTSVGMTRLPPTGSCIVVHTRWHPEDLAGRLLQQRNEGTVPWEIVNLPAIDEEGRALAEALKPLGFLLSQKGTIGEYDWTSLYMGAPRPRGGQVFRDAYYFDALPTEGYKASIGVDLAYSSKTSADWSVRIDLLGAGGMFYVAAVHRAQVEARIFRGDLSEARQRYPGAPMWWYAPGPETGVADLLNTMDPALKLQAQPTTADKFVRAQPVAAKWNEGKVLLPRDAPWLLTFLRVVLNFTGLGDTVDDDVDALAAAYDAMTGKREWWKDAAETQS